MNRVGLVGCHGWLGSYLSKFLQNGSVDYPENKIISLSKEMDIANCTCHIRSGDIKNYRDCIEFTHGLDTVIDTVGIIHPKKVIDFYNINTKGTDNLIRASIINGVKRFIYVSSNSAFGTRPYSMTEQTTPEPYMAYGRSKLLAEKCIIEHEEDIEYVILRPCWFYGEGQPDRQTKLFNMIKKGKPMIFGNGNNLRSMTYIGNLSQAIYLAVKGSYFDTDFWIADHRPYTTNEIYTTISELLNAPKYKPRHIPGISCSIGRLADKYLQKLGRYNQYVHVLGEMDQDIACTITKAKRYLGYEPKVDLREGMKRSIEWCKVHGKI